MNQRLGEALADALRSMRSGRGTHLVITASADMTDAANRVRSEERDAVLHALDAAGVPFIYEPDLARAVDRALDGSRPEELVLLLGAQGMDRAADLTRTRLSR